MPTPPLALFSVLDTINWEKLSDNRDIPIAHSYDPDCFTDMMKKDTYDELVMCPLNCRISEFDVPAIT